VRRSQFVGEHRRHSSIASTLNFHMTVDVLPVRTPRDART
jgi:hypothetical protein